MKLDEFHEILKIASKDSSFALKHLFPTVLKVQLHLIARIDDTVHVMMDEVKVHPQFEFSLTMRMRWTKNCLEERDAPEQIVLGSMNS